MGLSVHLQPPGRGAQMRQKKLNMCVCPGACDCVDRLVQGPSHEGNKKQKAD